jgi:serine phosphatase RsbU (regulator of sigma subunit)
VLLLVALVVVVVLATRAVYSNARRQALDQVRVRQELLAAQAARGMAGFYRGILDDLAFQRAAETGEAPPGTTQPAAAGSAAVAVRPPVPAAALSPLLWEKLRGRASQLVEIDPASGTILWASADKAGSNPRQIATGALPWLRSITKPSIGEAVPVNGSLATLVAEPVPGERPHVLVAVVPMLAVESRYLNDFNQPDNMASILVDDRMRVVSAERRELLGTDLLSTGVDPRVREVAGDAVKQGQRGTREFLRKLQINGVELDPAMVTFQPVDLPDGRRWWLGVSSSLADVDAAVAQFFRRALIGAGVVILAMTGILVSTSTQMIRGRLRLERVQREVLTRELDQAREIQLMWLPERQGVTVPLDVAAINRPASHVSGDFYNWFELGDGRACVVIGDVTGHGLPAAFLMATTQLLVRTMMSRFGDPGRTLREVNKQLCTHVFSGQFVTLQIMVVDQNGQAVELATAGHPPPLIGAGEAFVPLEMEPQLVLAVDEDVPYRTQRFELPPGASILLYTDGVTDVQAPDGQRLGQPGLERSLYGRYTGARGIVDATLDAIDAFRAGREPADDLTLVAIQLAREPAALEPVPLQPATRTA